jgi:ribosomal protein L11 methylase PrmA
MLDEGQLMAYLAPRGKVILSGIIEEQADEVRQAVGRAGGRVYRQLSAGDWICLIAEHENTP